MIPYLLLCIESLPTLTYSYSGIATIILLRGTVLLVPYPTGQKQFALGQTSLTRKYNTSERLLSANIPNGH